MKVFRYSSFQKRFLKFRTLMLERGRMEKNQLAKILEQAGPEIQYDEHAKRLLGNRRILAHIMKGSMEEYEKCSIADILSKIGTQIRISEDIAEPGGMNLSMKKEECDLPKEALSERIEGLQNEERR